MTQREMVLAWLKIVGETDKACIQEVIEQCEKDKEARAYYVGRYENETRLDARHGIE